MDQLLNIFAGISIGLIALILFSVRRAHIRVEYSVSWLGAALALLVLSLSRPLWERFFGPLGIHNPSSVLLILVGCLFILVLYRFSIIISALKDANVSLTQRVAILEYRLQSADETQRTSSRAGRQIRCDG